MAATWNPVFRTQAVSPSTASEPPGPRARPSRRVVTQASPEAEPGHGARVGNLFVMCGIVAIVSRPASRPTPAAGDLLAQLDRAVAAGSLTEAAQLVGTADALLHLSLIHI